MIGSITKVVGKLFGTKTDRDLKTVYPYVEKTNVEYAKLKGISDDELRNETQKLKDYISKDLEGLDSQIKNHEKELANNNKLDIHEKEEIFLEIDKLEKDRDRELEKVLLDVLPQGFAIVKETARRLKENKELIVEATDYDREIAAKKENVVIEGEKAVWKNKWNVAGHEIEWNMLHYDVQLVGGVVLHQGKVAEMATGEGKTLVATLPSFLNALAQRGVHIVTVNDYLAKRDAEWMAPLMEFHKLKVDCIDKYQPHSPERMAAYRADITYGTNNEFGFDYLRDNMSHHPDELVQRKHHFAMVDEVDSVLIDEARTPLIISGPVPKGDEQEFFQLKPRIEKLVNAQRTLVMQYLNEAKKLIKEGKKGDGGLALFRVHRGLPKYKPLIKFLGEPGMRQLLQKTEGIYLQENSKRMPEADEPLFFTIDEQSNSIDLTEKGLELITKEGEDKHFFVLPDIGSDVAIIENKEDIDEIEKNKQKDQLITEYNAKSQRIHTVNQLLKAYALFEKDVDYILVEDKVKIVDEQTGRVMEGRRYSDGLHQALEAKENVNIEEATQTYATVTLQNYFRMYHKLAGMTGTAETEAGEFWEIYKLDVVVIPTNRPIIRKDREDKVYKTMREKFNAVVEEIQEMVEANRPVLVGTTSVEISELLSRFLTMRKIKHQVLNAKQHAREAEVVASAGLPKAVTIATNMAGRGTDIKLTDEAKQAGGLAIIGTERHESRRVDRQLRGRSGRQGDPGSSQFFVSLEDNLMRLFSSDRMAKVMDRLGLKEGEVIQHSLITKSIERAQKKVEENNFAIRKRLLEYDDVMNSQRELIYKRRHNALFGERLSFDIMNMFYEVAESIAGQHKDIKDYEEFKIDLLTTFGISSFVSEEEFKVIKEQELTDKMYDHAYQHYQEKTTRLKEKTLPVLKQVLENRGGVVEEIAIPLTDGKKMLQVVANLKGSVDTKGAEVVTSLEKRLSLAVIDHHWKEHLREMDQLKEEVRTAVHEQKEPLMIYKFEAFELFKQLMKNINEEVTSFLSKTEIAVNDSEDVRAAESQKRARQKLNEKKEESGSLLQGGGVSANAPRQNVEVTKPLKSQKVRGRNDKVSVKYNDGTVKDGVKFKQVEKDILEGKCIIVE